MLAGSAAGFWAAVASLGASEPPSLQMGWGLPIGAIALRIDALSALFLLPVFLWFALANPILAASTGDRYFCTNQRGQVFYTTASSVTPNYTTCDIPTNMLLVR